MVYIINNKILHPVGILRQDQAALVFHHGVGAGLEKARVNSALAACHGILCLVPVAMAIRGREDLHAFQAFPAQTVQAICYPLGLQPGFLFIIHVPEIAAAAELGHGTFPIHPMGGFFEDFHNLTGGPTLLGHFDADFIHFAGDGIGDKNGAAVDVGHTLALGSIVGDGGFVNLILS